MKSKKALILVILILFIQSGVFGQTIDNEQFPFSVKWKQIETEYCILIFPENLEAKAKDIALTIDSYFPADEASLNTEVDKWPVIINNTLVYVNGYVMGAPEHSQLYTIPPQEGFNGTGDWIPFLWSHELRHIVQNEKMIRGFTAFAAWLAGEYGSSGMSHFALPNWIWEGDAVLTETLLSSGGRGRIAGFDRSMRTNLLNDIRFDYQKSSLGYYASYKSNIPSWYSMGYHLCTHIRKEYGMDAFNRILELSADYSFMPLVLNIAVKQVTHKSISEVYKDCLNELKPLWEQQLEGRIFTDAEIIKSAEEGDYSNYYPLGRLDGKLAALKTSTSSTYSLVTINEDGKEKLLRKINPIDTNVSFNGSTFCWAESKKDIRWGNKSWSVIRTYNPAENKYRLITEKTRYLSPSISPDGSRIAAIEITGELDSYIVVIDAAYGRLISRIPEPEGAAPSQTSWTEDGKGIVYVRQFDWMKSLRLLNPETEKNIGLTEPAVWEIGYPEVSGNFVYFVSEETGLENIHRVNLDGSRKSSLVISRMYAAASPAADGNTLYFSDYSVSGFAAASVELDNIPELNLSGSHVDYFSGLEAQEPFAGCAGPGINTAEITNASSSSENYIVENYNIAAGLWNFHSRIIGTSSSGTGLTIGLQADGIMNNTSSKLYSGYDPSEQEFMIGLSGAWAGFYPVLLYGAELQSPQQSIGTILDSSVYGGAWLPLDLSSGILNHSLSLQGVFIMENSIVPSYTALTAFQGQLDWTLAEYSAKRDLIPPLGVALSGLWYYNIDPEFYNFLFGEIRGYLPGLLENHGISLKLQAGYNFDSAVANRRPSEVPRGLNPNDYSAPLVFNSSIEYTLPLAYPELSVAGFLYIPRLFTNFFIDTAYIPSNKGLLQTTGLELYTDFHLINNSVPLRTGLRLIYNIIDGSMRFEDTVLSLGITLK